jgi:hypothetical protein
VATASGEVLNFRNDSTYPSSDSEAICGLGSGEDQAHDTTTFATVPAHGFSTAPGTQRGGATTISQTTVFHLPNGGTIDYSCQNTTIATKDAGATQQYTNMRVTAIQVGALH